MGHYSIKEVETLSGVKAHTLRMWEQRYDFLKPERTETNIRYYTDPQLRLLLNVTTLNRSGMKISKIAGLTQHELAQEVLKVFKLADKADTLLDSLVLAMLDFSEQRFENTLTGAITRLGFEDAFTELIFPFLRRTGVLWTTGEVRVVQEHFVTNLIRRKVCVAIDGVQKMPNEQGKRFILFLPEGETHELLLLFTEYLLRKRNHEVAYLGSSLPFEELAFVTEAFKPHFIVTYQTIALEHLPFGLYLQKLCSAFPQCRVMAGGPQLPDMAQMPPNCTPVYSTSDFLAAIV